MQQQQRRKRRFRPHQIVTTGTTSTRSACDVLPYESIVLNYRAKDSRLPEGLYVKDEKQLQIEYDRLIERNGDRPLNEPVTILSDMGVPWDDLKSWLIDLLNNSNDTTVMWISNDNFTVSPLVKNIIWECPKNLSSPDTHILMNSLPGGRKRMKKTKDGIRNAMTYKSKECVGVWVNVFDGLNAQMNTTYHERTIRKLNNVTSTGTLFLNKDYGGRIEAINNALNLVSKLSIQSNIYIKEKYVADWIYRHHITTTTTTQLPEEGGWYRHEPEMEPVLKFDENSNFIQLYTPFPIQTPSQRLAMMSTVAKQDFLVTFNNLTKQMAISWIQNYDLRLDFSVELAEVLDNVILIDIPDHQTVLHKHIVTTLVLSRLLVAHYKNQVRIPIGTIQTIVRHGMGRRKKQCSKTYMKLIVRNILHSNKSLNKKVTKKCIEYIQQQHNVSDEIFINILGGTYQHRNLSKSWPRASPRSLTKAEAHLESTRSGGLTPLSNVHVKCIPKVSPLQRAKIEDIIRPYKKNMSRQETKELSSMLNNYLLGGTQNMLQSNEYAKKLTGQTIKELIQ